MSDLSQWKHLKIMLKPHTKKICVIIFLMLLISGLNILIPFYQQKIVDDGVENIHQQEKITEQSTPSNNNYKIFATIGIVLSSISLLIRIVLIFLWGDLLGHL